MKRSFIIYIIVTLVTVSFCHGQYNLAVNLIPDSLKEGANKVVRYDETSFEIIDLGKGIHHTKYAITILNPKGKSAAKLSVGYSDLTRLNTLSATVYDASGKVIKKLKKNEIKDYSAFDGISILSDNRIKQIDLSQSNYPYTVEYTIEKVFDGLMYLPSWYIQTANKTSIQRANFNVKTPGNYSLKTKSHLVGEPIVKNVSGFKIYNWSLKNVKAIEHEYLNADPYYNDKYVSLAPTAFEMEGYTGDLTTWKSFGKWFNKLNEGRGELNAENVAEIKGLVKGTSNNKEKIRLIYEYLQRNTRYVSIQLGIGGLQPFKANYVSEKGFGDCKALTNYTKIALQNIGISSYYTIVNAGRYEKEIDTSFPSSQFNHVFLCVPNEQDTIWLECTSQTNPFGYLSDFTSDRDVLVLNEEGGHIVHTPAYDKDDNTYKTQGKIKLDMEGNADVELISTFSGLSYEYVSGFDKYDSKEKSEAIKSLFPIKSMDIKDFDFKEQKSEIPTASLSIDVTARKMATVSGKRFFLVPNQINQRTFKPTKYKNRESDFKVRYEKNTIDSIVFEIPENIYPESIPKAKSINTKFGTYETRFEKGPGVLKYYRKFTTNKGTYDKSLYADYVKFHEKCVKADKQKVVFLKST